jgi:hypothetical protein
LSLFSALFSFKVLVGFFLMSFFTLFSLLIFLSNFSLFL